jgi:hypothetical protein
MNAMAIRDRALMRTIPPYASGLNLELFEIFIVSDADVNILNNKKRTALTYALRKIIGSISRVT